jgi:iron complex outermembrane receptor protein
MVRSDFSARAAIGFSQSRSRALLRASALGLALVAIGGPGLAQTTTAAAEDEPILGAGDIIVTARKRDETLIDVPVAVTVVGGALVKDFQMSKVEDVTSRVPALNVQVGGSGSGGTLSLRGIGSSAISASFDSAVAFDFDGVQVSTMRLVQVGFFDVAQIEVLKGPQSLYFGKSASAGVLSLKSADPTPDFEVGARAAYEFEEEGMIYSGFVSGPISDTLGIRIAAQYSEADRYLRLQEGTPAVNNPRSLKDFFGRLTLNWRPADNLNANFKFSYLRNENDGAIATSDVYCGANGRADEVWLLQGAVAIPAGYNCRVNDGRYFLADTAPPLARSVPEPSRAVGYDGKPFGQTDLYFGRLRIDAGLTDTLDATLISGYVDLDAIDVDNYSYAGVGPAFSPTGLPLSAIAPALAAANGAGVPMGVGTSDPVNRLAQFTQEVRLTSNLAGPFNFMVGAFYETRKFTFDTSQQAVNISLIAPDPITGYTFDYKKIHITKTDAFSLFGSFIYQLTDQFELSGGLRYTEETKVNTIRIPYVHAFLTAGGFVRSGFFSGPIRFEDDNFSPELTLKYRLNDDMNLFASYKSGFKSGGIDNSALPSNALLGFASPDPAVREATAEGLIYQSEKAKGGEIGFKGQFADNSVSMTATAYLYKFTDLQVQTFNATTIQFVTQNAGEVTTKGIEVDGRWATPLDGLTLSGSLGLLDGKYTKDFINPGPDGRLGTADDINLRGRKVSRAPTWSGNLAFDWKLPVGGSLAVGLGGNMTFSSSYITNNVSFEDYVQDSWTTFDGRISFGQIDDRWRIALVGVNLADKIYVNTSGARPFLAPANPFGVPVGDDIIVSENRGRQLFIEASLRF